KLRPAAVGPAPADPIRSDRMGSPYDACSTLTTSAPQSARTAPAAGTNHHCATSTTLTPAITPAIAPGSCSSEDMLAIRPRVGGSRPGDVHVGDVQPGAAERVRHPPDVLH